MATLNSGLGGPAGFGENVFSTSTKTVGGNDDGAVQIDVTSVFSSGISFFGATYTDIYINSNGAITFGTASSSLDNNGANDFSIPALLPFYSDINIESGGEIYWDVDPSSGKITVTWDSVAPYSGSGTNSFQVVLSDLGNGDMGVEYIYGDIQWGDSGGNAAYAGFTDGGSNDYALEFSGNSASMQGYETNDFDNGDPAGTFSFSTSGGVPDNLVIGGGGGNDIMGLGFVDSLGNTISTAADVIDGGAGNDNIDGDEGNDTILGGVGDDTILSGSGGSGSITWTAVAAGSDLHGSTGQDYFQYTGGAGTSATIRFNNSVDAGDADGIEDYLHVLSTGNNINLEIGDFDPGLDKIILSDGFSISSSSINGSYADLTVTLNNGNQQFFRIHYEGGSFDSSTVFTTTLPGPPSVSDDDLLDGGDDADTFVLEDHFGADTILGGSGGNDADEIDARGLTSGVTISFTQDETGTLVSGSDTLNFTDIESFSLTSQADSLSGTGAASSIVADGGAGNDTLVGGSGGDTLIGGADNDTLTGDNAVMYEVAALRLGVDYTVTAGDLDSGGFGTSLSVSSTGAALLVANNGEIRGDTPNEAFSHPDQGIVIDGRVYGVLYDDLISYTDDATGDTYTFAVLDVDLNSDGTAGTGEDGYYLVQVAGPSVPDGANLTFSSLLDNDPPPLDLTGFETGGADSLVGGAGADSILGGLGADTLLGGIGNDTLDGGDGADSLFGGDGDDSLRYAVGGDTLDGGSGDDRLEGGFDQGTDDAVLIGGAGNDTIVTYGANDTVYGGDDQDFINADSGNELLDGGAGNDTILANSGDDTITGGAGDDSMEGGADADTFILLDGFGNDTISGGESSSSSTDTDRIDGSGLTGGVAVVLTGLEAGTFSSGGSTALFTGIEEFSLTDFDDSLDNSSQTIGISGDGGAGNDTLTGGSGADTLAGGDGDDLIDGGAGDDFLTTGLGQDTLLGGDGDDTLMNSDGDDSLVGGAGDDSIVATGGDDTLEGGAGNDTLIGGDHNDRLVGGTGNDSMDGGNDADTFIIEDGFGNDTIKGGEGTTTGTDNDVIDLSAVSSAVTVTYTGDEAGTITDGTDTINFSEIEELILTDQGDTVDATADGAGITIDGRGGDDTVQGGTGHDSIVGGLGNDDLDGNGGDDTLDGGAGNDRLFAGTGNDSVSGGADNDSLWSGSGNSTLDGGSGDDYIEIDEHDGDTTIIGGSGTDTVDFDTANSDGVSVAFTSDGTGTYAFPTGSSGNFTQIEQIDGTQQDDNIDAGSDTSGIVVNARDGNDTVTGGSGNDSIDAGGGNDTVFGGSGSDTLVGGAGNDDLQGQSGDDVLDGGDGADSLSGGADNDSVSGGTGQDILLGDAGNDTLDGGADDDTLSAGSGDDSVSGGSGNDLIFGNSGDDTISGGTGDDSITGGDGNDVFIYSVGDGNDTITDFNFGNTGALGDGDTTNNDFINLASFYDNMGELRADFADDGVLNQSNTTANGGETVDYSDNAQFGTTDSLTFQGASESSFTQDNTGVACFTPGIRIATDRGQIAVEHLRIGDRVQTADNGYQPIVWIGRRYVSHHELARYPELKPILINPNPYLGNTVSLCVSPQHRFVLKGDYLGELRNMNEAFIRAKFLPELAQSRARVRHGVRNLMYIHLMTEQHEVIFAENVATETFWPGSQALQALGDEDFKALEELFPDVTSVVDQQAGARKAAMELARASVKRKDLKMISHLL